ncbi:permease prefix domain 1-containing protein [Micromonospora soli]|uniref:permease prefix domain 1-containing protein n=1 Tax=Micromonospora sp. NBRC 110009 TaxID=3061627 RepID=UPI0026710092|nr:permease prefix domain 1-containing protein [Micromonospora sp. NBRC 110009]WKT98935.1 permease prefix domain 1-containing protein [Micromonospora sp. NBRC 110009]
MSSLTDRYLAATLRAVPEPRRAEIATELRASIEDMIDDRTGAGQDADTAEREVLTELGNPDQLAAGYTDRRLQLIGPRYFLVWWRLLRMLLTFVPAIVGVTTGVIKATVGGEPGAAIGAGVAAALQTAVQTAFWITLLFAVAERLDGSLKLPEWTVDQLPEAPRERQVTLVDSCASMAFLVVAIAFLPWQHFQPWMSGDGSRLPMIDPALWSFWLPALIVVLVASMGLEVAKYRAGRWTWPLVAGNALLDLAFAVPVAWLLLTDRLLNPALVDRFGWLREGGAQDAARLAVAVTAALVVWDVIDSAVKTRRQAG